MPEQQQEVPRTVVEKVMDRLGTFAKNTVDDFGEVRSVILVIDWAVGQNDFPAGMVYSREKQMTLADILQINGQLNKMAQRLSNLYVQQLNNSAGFMKQADIELANLEARRTKLREEIEALERRKDGLTGAATTGAVESP